MPRNLKIFLASGIPAGIIAAILYSSLYDINIGLQSGFVLGLVFGFVMVLILGVLHSHAVKKIAGNTSAESMNICQVRDIELPFPYDRAFDLCIESLNLISRCRITDKERSQGKIIARSSINWKTWGDTISFEITGISDDKTSVKIASRPTSRTTIVDYGKNLENVRVIVLFLEK